MDVQTELPSTLPEPAATSQPQMSVSEAARALASARYAKPAAETMEAVTAPDKAAPAQESTAQAEDAAPPQEAPGETQEAEPAELPPIERPRSWTKEVDEPWQSLPRTLQEIVAQREQEREAETRRSQNEAAEARKAHEAKMAEAEQARQKYETTLPVVLEMAKQQFLSDFPDVRGPQDVDRLIREEPQRYLLLQNRLQQMDGMQRQIMDAQQRQGTEKQQKFTEFAKEQDRIFAEKAPEMRSDKTAKELRDQSLETLKAIGFTEDELGKAWSGGDVSLRDHRVQLLIRDATLWRDAQAKAKAKTTQAKPVPPVQRPGTSRPAGADNAAQVQQLESQLDSGKLTVRQQLEVAAKLRSIKGTLIARKAS